MDPHIKNLQDKKIVANRSLQSEHHALNLPPKKIKITWVLGKRCNYDCSYCSPHIHDNYSPHTKTEEIFNFIDKIDSFGQQQDKTVDIYLTGGEPCVHPDIVDISRRLSEMRSKGSVTGIITNGSMPVELYEKCLEHISHLTISLHLERSMEECQKVVDKIKVLAKIPDKFISVQLMCYPGKFDFVRSIKKEFEENNVKFTLRRITPDVDHSGDKKYMLGTKMKQKFSLEEMTVGERIKLKQEFIEQNKKKNRQENIYSVYTEEELQWMRDSTPKTRWTNMGVWFDDGTYEEYNNNEVNANDKLKFKDWICFAGVDHLYIDYDGSIYRGQCQAHGPIGHLKDTTIEFPKMPTICPYSVCTSETDIPTRRACSSHYLKHIT